VRRYLFVCSQNKLRSPTAEQVFADWPGLSVLSAGTNNDAVTTLDTELVEWADSIFVMERTHRNKLQKKFRKQLGGKRIICLDIPDEYNFMEDALVDLLKDKMQPWLPMVPPED